MEKMKVVTGFNDVQEERNNVVNGYCHVVESTSRDSVTLKNPEAKTF